MIELHLIVVVIWSRWVKGVTPSIAQTMQMESLLVLFVSPLDEDTEEEVSVYVGETSYIGCGAWKAFSSPFSGKCPLKYYYDDVWNELMMLCYV